MKSRGTMEHACEQWKHDGRKRLHVCRRLKQCRHPSMHAHASEQFRALLGGAWAHTAVWWWQQ